MVSEGRFFLFVSSTDIEAATSRLEASGISFRRKRLDSRPYNWDIIADILDDPLLAGCVIKLTNRIIELFCLSDYAEPGRRFCESLSGVPHIVFLHEALLAGIEPVNLSDDDLDRMMRSYYFGPPSSESMERFLGMVRAHNLTIVPYRSNAELSVLAEGFVSDHDQSLLFRMYVPSARIWSSEVAKFLALFRDWLTGVKGYSIREDGYETRNGRVFEFYGDNDDKAPTKAGMADEFREFSRFLEVCVSDPDAAENALYGGRAPSHDLRAVVDKYSREAKRLFMDLKQERESRVLSLRHKFELELAEEDLVDSQSLAALVDSIVPNPTAVSLESVADSSALTRTQGLSPSGVSQGITGSVEGAVIQNIDGTINLTADARSLLELVSEHAGSDATNLESAVFEVEDDDARPEVRHRARQRLKGFVYKISDRVEQTLVAGMQKYLEAKLGL